MTLRILLTGATGYVGGTTLTTLLARGGDVKITCLVRGNNRAALLRKQLAVATVVVDLDDTEKVKKAAAEADVVINAANADHPTGAQALVDGLEDRLNATGKKCIIVHLSGTGSLADQSKGEPSSGKIYQDLDCADIRLVPVTKVHRSTDLVITSASERGVVKGYVVMPPLIYGLGTGPFSRTSVQIPALIRGTLKLGKAPYMGKGLGMWNGCYVQDLVDLLVILMDDGLSANPQAATGDEGYYFTATDTFQWKQLAAKIGERLHAKGAIATAEPYSVNEEDEIAAVFGPSQWSAMAYASHSLSKPIKAYKLGWKPKTAGIFDSIDAEYDAVIEEGKENAPKVHVDAIDGLWKAKL
ncbi:NAD(P)-binding protein [Gymnopus androsaceus JB14]|uniref:NAD(P)-binding protein n=1 Tax=Gymnopus androsaceus JB14 TaxID=1447944 RepID=A0A6A4IA85_9AGAR|nr:NAD(P)-binding protein [Gymnopus androsaceus JB14]